MNEEQVLKHYGKLGMRWGKHKQKESAYRQKLTAIGKNRSVNAEDAKRFKYRNQHVAKRIGKTAASMTAQIIVSEVLKAHLGKRPIALDKKTMHGHLKRIITETAINVTLNDALAKSASKRYTDTGKKVPGTKNYLMSKEKAIEKGVKLTRVLLPVARWMISRKASSVRAERSRNEAAFKRFGENVLAQKVNEVIFTTMDAQYHWKD